MRFILLNRHQFGAVEVDLRSVFGRGIHWKLWKGISHVTQNFVPFHCRVLFPGLLVLDMNSEVGLATRQFYRVRTGL